MSVFSPGTELKRMTRGRLPKVALVVLLFIPLIYGALYLWAFWAPTDRMSDLPVALVNEDQAATASDGTEVSAGDDLVDTLLDRRDLDWHLTDADDAQDGMSNGGYYFAVTIPEDFSQRIASLDTDAQTAEIEVDYNDTNSFLADTLGKQAMKQVRDTLAETVSQEQADKVLVGVNKLSDGIRDAADAAGEVNDGAQQLKDGNTQLADGATTLTAGLGDLADGTASLADGAGQVAQGAQTAQNGSQQLAAGAGQLSSGAAQASSGVAALQSGATAFASGMSTESQGLAQLNQKVNGEASTEVSNMPVWQAAQELSGGASKVSSGVKTLSETSETLKTLQDNSDLRTANEAIEKARTQIHSMNPDFPVEPKKDESGLSDQSDLISVLDTDTKIPQADKISLLEEIKISLFGEIKATGKANSAIATLQQADVGITTVQLGQISSLEDGANKLAGDATKLAGAIGSRATDPKTCTAAVSSAEKENAGSTPKLTETVCALSNGAATLNKSFGTETDTSSDTLLGGINQLASGTTQLASGSDTLATNLNQLVAGLGTLSDGSSQVASGADQLNTGAESAESGSAQLADGAQQASDGATQLADGTQEFSDTVSDGAAEAPDYSDGQTQSMSETIANAVSLAETTHNAVQGFGEGFAPFFIALATFVGALITWLILRPLPSRPMAVGASGLRTVLNGFVPASVLGLGQVIIMLAVLVWGIGVRPTHPIAMALFVLLTTFAFLTFQQMLIIVFGSAPGRVVALVLLMFQLSSSGGTYPVETTPKFFWWIHPYMPASYVVDGLRPLIGGGVDGRFWVALVFMSGLFLISLLISAIAAQAQRVWTVGRLHPEITI